MTAPDAPGALDPARRQVSAGTEAVSSSEVQLAFDEVLPVGTLVGQRYVIEQHISSGGFGAVYRASDREIRHHQVALKLLHRPSASEEERQAALRELKLLATVAHPSVVQFKEYGWHEGRLWFAMPWYRGQTLDQIIGDERSPVGMKRAEARSLFTRIAHGLAAMHAMGIHHHDIKPENIFVAQIAGFPGGLPVLLDLGIATQRGENPIGLTIEYASPETASAMLGDVTVPIGGAADVYSLALVLRNTLDPTLITQTAASEDVMTTLRERVAKPAVLSLRRDLRYLAPHFRRWLSHDPSERPTAAELAAELAVLTAPEEKRQAMLRFLRRSAPMFLLIAVIVAGLVLRLRQRETTLVVQRQELQHQREVEQALRRQSEAQLERLDFNAEQLGSERKHLKETLAFAHTLNSQLAAATTRFEELDRRHSELTAQRDALVVDRHRLSDERDALSTSLSQTKEERDAAVGERDQAARERDALARERDELTRERDALVRERDALVREGDELTRERDAFARERDELTRARDALARERDGLARARDLAEHERDAAVGERDRANAENRALDERLSALTKERERAEREPRTSEQNGEAVVQARTRALAQKKQLQSKRQEPAKTGRARDDRPMRSQKKPPIAPRRSHTSEPATKRRP